MLCCRAPTSSANGKHNKSRTERLSHSLLCPEGRCGGFIALDPLLRLLEGGHRWSGHRCAIWLPLLVLLFLLRPVAWASTIGRDVEGLLTSNANAVQTCLCEQILTHGAVLSILDAHLPIQTLLARVDVLNQGGEGLRAVDLQIAEVTIVNILAILQVDSRWRHELVVFQPNLHAICDENCISIQLQHPISILILTSFSDLLPDLSEHASVDPRSRGLPLSKVPIALHVCHHCCHHSASHFDADIAENCRVIALEDAKVLRLLVLEDLQLVAWLARAGFLRVDGEAIHCLAHRDGILQDRVHYALRLCAGLSCARGTILQALCLSWLCGEAVVTDYITAPCCEAILIHLRACLPLWHGNDLRELLQVLTCVGLHGGPSGREVFPGPTTCTEQAHSSRSTEDFA